MQSNDAAQPFVIPRASLTWLLASHVAVILPHVSRIPLWMTLISIICVVWRIMVFRQRAAFPSKWIKNILVLAGLGGILFHYRTLLGAEAGTSLLLVMFDLKLLEMLKRRDAYVVVVLAYFVAATQFMFANGIATALYGFFSMTLVTAALLGLHQNSTHRQPLRTARLATVLMLQAIPLMLCLFYLFPRIPPLWQMDPQQSRARLGFSEEMSPGDVSELSKSDALAFRVEFSNKTQRPQPRDLYWRGAVLTRFDGHKWRISEPERGMSIPWVNWGNESIEYYWNRKSLRKQESMLEYTVIMEPHNSKWLFALDTPYSKSNDIGLTREFTLQSRQAVNETKRYVMYSYLQYLIDPELEAEMIQLNTGLPSDSNPRTQQFAKKLFAQSARDPKRYIYNILKWYNTDNFTYTLKPPKLTGHTVDEFLFTTQRGFCEHFASATAFLARAVGIPARVVVGYQGGEWNELGQHYLVHQYDAHAWTEVWFEHEGWVRVDGTGAVSPDRIERGFESALSEEHASELGPFSGSRVKHMPVLGRLRLAVDYMDFAWSKYVLNFDKDDQIKLFEKLFGGFDAQRAGLVMLSVFAAVVGLLSLVIFSGSSAQKLPQETRLYLEFCNRMAKRGFILGPGETPASFAHRIAAAAPELADSVHAFTSTFSTLCYAKPDPATSQALVAQLLSSLRVLNKQLRRYRAH